MEKHPEQEAQQLIFNQSTKKQMPLEITVYQDHKSLVVLAIICFAIPAYLFLLLGFVLLVKAHYSGSISYDDLLSFIIAIGSAGFVFGPLGLWINRLGLKAAVILTIHPQGITIGKKESRLSLAISWPEIASIRATNHTINMQSQKLLSIRPKNLKQYLARLSFVARMIARINIATIGAPLGIFQTALNLPIEEIFQQIAGIYADELERYEIQLNSEL